MYNVSRPKCRFFARALNERVRIHDEYERVQKNATIAIYGRLCGTGWGGFRGFYAGIRPNNYLYLSVTFRWL